MMSPVRLACLFASALCIMVNGDDEMGKIGYLGHPDRISHEWLAKELKNDVPSDKALEACCNVENDGIWMNACTMWDREDSWCHYQNKCWTLLRKFAFAAYSKQPKGLYQMVLDGAENRYNVSDFVNCSRAEFRHEPVLSGCVVRSVCQRYVESYTPPGFANNLGKGCSTPLESFTITNNTAMSEWKTCDVTQEVFKMTAKDCLRACHKNRLNQVRPCEAAVFGPNERCVMYSDRSFHQDGRCNTVPASGRQLIELRSACKIR